MKRNLHRILALFLALLLLTGTASVGFAASSVAQVTDLRLVSETTTTVKIKWKSVSKASGYVIELYDAAAKKWLTEADVKKTTYVDDNLTPGTKYGYRVKAYVKSGGSKTFGKVSEKLVVVTKPEQVLELHSTEATTATHVALEWTAAVGATGYAVLKKDATTGGEFVEVGQTKKTTYSVDFPAAPGSVWFKVKSIAKRSGIVAEAKPSKAVKLQLGLEPVSTLTEQTATPTSMTLAWNEVTGATTYEVFMYDPFANDFVQIGATSETTFTVEGLEPATPYQFAVKAVADYEGAVQRTEFGVTLSTYTGFDSVTGFDYVLTADNKLFLSWNSVKNAGGYSVEKSIDGKTDWVCIAETDETVFEASSVENGGMLTKGRLYYYRVRAFAAVRSEMMYTAYSEVIEIHAIPDTPTITRAATAAQHGICVEWADVSGADGYCLERYSTSNDSWKLVKESLLDDKDFLTYTNEDGRKTVYYLHRNLTSSRDYQYRVRSFSINKGANMYSPYSNIYTHSYTYSPEPQAFYAEPMQQIGLVGYLYDPVEEVFFTSENPWQRSFGFNEVYDIVSQGVYIQYDTVRIKFSCHEGEQWLIQPWKGQYGWLFFGSEVGIYKQYSERDVEHYDSAREEDELMMEMDLYRKHFPNNWVKEFHRPYGSYWWITGFKPGFVRFVDMLKAQDFQTYDDLRLDLHITMMDFDMRNAFVKAVQAENAKNGGRFAIANYGKNSLDLYLQFS